jgi:hypothetical protein
MSQLVKRRSRRTGMFRGLIQRPSRSRYERDAEVAEFLREILPTREYLEAMEECRARFGADRTPSRSSIQRFAARMAKRAGPAGLGNSLEIGS